MGGLLSFYARSIADLEQDPTAQGAIVAVFQSGATLSSFASRFLAPGGLFTTTAGQAERPVGQNGTLTNLYVSIDANTLDDFLEITLFINGLSTALGLTVPATTGGVFTATGSIPVSDVDTITVQADAQAAGSGSVTGIGVTIVGVPG